jgi:DnaJ-class molecular chaperone
MRQGDWLLTDRTVFNPPRLGAAARGAMGPFGGPTIAPSEVSVALKVCVEPHPLYARRADDLVVVRNITLAEAVCGCEFALPHPSRKQVAVALRAGQIRQPGHVHTMRGRE